jgi:hypothetical protein
MTDEEVEIVARELAKIGGTSWYPGRQPGSILRLVSDRYRDQARAIIQTVDTLRHSDTQVCPEHIRSVGEDTSQTQGGLMR